MLEGMDVVRKIENTKIKEMDRPEVDITISACEHIVIEQPFAVHRKDAE